MTVCSRCERPLAPDAETCVDHDPIYCGREAGADDCTCPTVCAACCSTCGEGAP